MIINIRKSLLIKRILFFFIFLISFFCSSQSIVYKDSVRGIYTDEINSENILRITKDLDEFIIIKNYNEQKIQIAVIDEKGEDLVHTSDSDFKNYQEFLKYLIYKKNNRLFVKKFDNFGEYNSIEIKNDFIFPFLNKHIKKIKEEELKPYCVKSVSIGNKIVYDLVIIPSPIYTEIYLKSKHLKTFTKYHFSDMKNENEDNINFAKNLKLKVIKLEIMCKTEIEKLEMSKSFVRN